MRRPTVVEPVNAIFATSECVASRSPAVFPKPGTMFTTPFGNPTSRINSAKRKLVSGVNSLGFRTIVFPAARAGPIFQLQNINGKFHGTIAPTTPSGSRKT